MTFIRTRIMPLLAHLSNYLPQWVYWQILWHVNQKFLIGACVVIMDENSNVLLFRHIFRPAGYEWGLPGGWIKRGETIEHGLEREVFEESHLRVRILQPLSVNTARSLPRLDLFFLGQPLDGNFQASNEVTAVQYFSVEDLPHIIPEQKQAILTALRQAKSSPKTSSAEKYSSFPGHP